MTSGNAAVILEEILNNEDSFSTGEDFDSLLEESASSDYLKEGNIVKGIIVAIEHGDTAVIDVGLKSEGRVPLKEFAHGGTVPELKVNDEVEVFLEKYENSNGEAVLSREKALREEAWIHLEKAWNAGEQVQGVIFGRVKGGFTVDINGAVAFLPGSQVDIRPVRDVTPLMNIEQPFMILKMDRKRGNIVVSRRAILEESRSEARNELLEKMKEGVTLEGIVKNITDYGAFIDLGGVDGLLHVTDISWKRINHPSEVLSVGQTIKVVVTKFDESNKRVSLGMKQLESNPWDGIGDSFKVGQKFTGRVTNITDYGAFVELQDGIEGLVHVSEMSWTKKNVHPSKIVSSSQEVEVVVLDVDTDKCRISLGMKQCTENPWHEFSLSHKTGDIIEGEIKNITDFGIFVGLDGDIDGLIHHSDISWNESGDVAIQEYGKGQLVKAKILAIDVDKERISLGIKQLTEGSDAADKDSSSASSTAAGGTNKGSAYKKGSIVTCTVSAVSDKGIDVTLNDGVNAFIKRSDLSSDRQDQRPDRFAVGDRVDAKITSVDKKTQKIGLSIKALEVEEQKRAIAEYGSTDSGASLGDILGAALSEAKAESAAEEESASLKEETTKEGAEAKEVKTKKTTKSKKTASATKKASAKSDLADNSDADTSDEEGGEKSGSGSAEDTKADKADNKKTAAKKSSTARKTTAKEKSAADSSKDKKATKDSKKENPATDGGDD